MQKLNQVQGNLSALMHYTSGSTESPIDLVKREMAGDQETKEKLERMIALQEERMTPLLHDTDENIGHLTAAFGSDIRRALSKFEEEQ